jgi:hypothetical protein
VRSLLIADCQFPIADFNCDASRLKSAIGNRQYYPETPKRGQGVKYPDRFFAKAANSLTKFFGSNASALNTPLT